MTQVIWAPGLSTPEQPSIARARLYWLTDTDPRLYTDSDRQLAESIMVCAPHLPYGVRVHRHFLRRVVQHLVKLGIRQFLDLGSGVPAVGNVHEVAHGLDGECRVVYVDIDPVVVAEGRELLAGQHGVGYAQADLRHPEEVLAAPEVRALLDIAQPVAVLLVDTLHFVPDSDEPAGLVAAYTDAFSPGSYLAVSHMGKDDGILAAMQMFSRMYGNPLPSLTFRGEPQLADICAGLSLTEPGIVPVPLWQPDPGGTGINPESFPDFALLAQKP